MKEKNLNFKLKTVTGKQVKKEMDKMKRRKSSGADGVSQEYDPNNEIKLKIGKEEVVQLLV